MKKISNNNSSKHNNRGKILVIDDEPEIGWIFSKILSDNGYEVTSSQTGKGGLKQVQKAMPDLVFLDLKLSDCDGISVLKEIKNVNPDVLVIMITAHETIQTAVQAMKLGAYDYIPKPIPNERLKIIVDKALETQSLSREVKLLRKGADPLSEIIGQSHPMQKLFKLVRSAASHDVSVILRGESGTGKELVARAIYALSGRRNKPFIPVDCATLPETLVESELFGYEKGAFTGADALKIGKLETANRGTLFLDEIGNLTTHIQVKLLRILQERKIERLGGKGPISIDVRIISATNMDLEKAVGNGEFRDDLYHRLNVFEIILPPLRERGDDISLLAQYFLERFNREMGKNIKGFSDEAIDSFKNYSWPGNVRELENTVKSAIILAKDRILPGHLSSNISKSMEANTKGTNSIFSNPKTNSNSVSLKEAKRGVVEDAEKYLIEKTLNETGWNKKKAAQALDIDYKSLFTKIKKYGIKK